MGGYFSTRWGFERTRTGTDGLLQLDVRNLKRMGALQAGARATLEWTRGNGEPAGNIVTIMDRDGDRLTLDYATRASGEPDWTPRRLHIWLDRTPCHFGGERAWFRCPHCQGRRAVLFSAGGIFSCRGCHDLAYTSTREEEMDRCTRRIRTLQRKLQAPGDADPWYMIPGKPAGMHWTTYERLQAALLSEMYRRDAIFGAHLAALARDVDQLLAQRKYLQG